MFVIGARTTRHVNQDGVCTEIYFSRFFLSPGKRK